MLMQKFFSVTNGKYDFLKLSKAQLVMANKVLELTILYPEEKAEAVLQQKEDIVANLNKVFDLKKIGLKIELKRSHFDRNHFLSQLVTFFAQFPSIYHAINDSRIEVEEGQEIVLTLTLERAVYDYYIGSEIPQKLQEFLNLEYCQKFVIKYVQIEDQPLVRDAQYISTFERAIYPKQITRFVGSHELEKAAYISDIKEPRLYVVLCGRIKNYAPLEKRQKSGIDYKDKFFKFELEDYTGSINALVFPHKSTYALLCDDLSSAEVICSGEVVSDNFGGRSQLKFMVKTMSKCVLPSNFSALNPVLPLPMQYTTVFPIKGEQSIQQSFFDNAPTAPKYVLDNTFVVFDLETTGLSSEDDHIIEIGAVKVQGGKVVEEFSTFVNPCVPISPAITNLTSITNEDVQHAPLIKDVIGDFLLFCKDSILVAHNIDFDYAFIAKAAKQSQFAITNKKLDTVRVARRALPNLRSHSLKALAKYFNITNESAHRAISDAKATVRLFLHLCDLTDPQIA